MRQLMRQVVIGVGSMVVLLVSLWIGAHWILAPFTPSMGWARTWSEVRSGQVKGLAWRASGWQLTTDAWVQILIGAGVIGLGVLVGVLGLRAVRPRHGEAVIRQGARWATRRDLKRKGLL